MTGIWLRARSSVNGRGAKLFQAAVEPIRPSRSRIIQRPIISTATTPSPAARPIQMPTPLQPASKGEPDADCRARPPNSRTARTASARACRAARAACRADHLRAVEHLEHRRDGEEATRQARSRAHWPAHRRGTAPISSRGKIHISQRHRRHEADAQRPAPSSRRARSRRGSRAPDARPTRTVAAWLRPERDHEASRPRSAARSHGRRRFGVDPAHQIDRGGEHRAFERHGQADRQAEPPDVAEAAASRRATSARTDGSGGTCGRWR